MKKKIMSALGLVLVMFTLVLAGCSGTSTKEGSGLADISTAQGETLSDSGVLILRINPEIAIKYNEDGVVTDVVGKNEDGREIVKNYTDYIGKDSGLVLEELVTVISEAGYFVEEIEGEPKRIVLELESGSILPEDKFLENMTTNIQTAVSKLNVDSKVVSNDDILSLDEAKQIALKDAQVKEDDAKFDDKELDEDDGNLIYELEFYANDHEYEYDVHAVTGDILNKELDHEDKPVKQDSKPEKTQGGKSTQEAATKKKGFLSMDQAKQIAFKHAGVKGADARFDDQEFDVDDGVPSYELEFKVNGNEYEYDIHAESGTILDYEQDIKPAKKQAAKPAPKKQEVKNTPKSVAKPAPKPAEKPALKKQAAPKQLSKDEAINVALKHAGLSRSQVHFDDVELDEEDGRLEWELEFESGNWEFEYEIDARTGRIIDFEKDHDD